MAIQPSNLGSPNGAVAPNSASPSTPLKPTGQPNQHSQRRIFEVLLAGLIKWVWGPGKADIQRQIQQATPDTLATIIGHIVYALVQQGAEQGAKAGHDLTMDMLLGVATDLIESLEKMAAALNMQFDPHAVAMQALTQALNDYAESLPDGSAAQKEAQDALKQLSPSAMHQAAGTINTIGQRNGVSPFAPSQQVQQASEQAAGQGDGNDDAQPDNGQDVAQQRQGLMGAGQ